MFRHAYVLHAMSIKTRSATYFDKSPLKMLLFWGKWSDKRWLWTCLCVGRYNTYFFCLPFFRLTVDSRKGNTSTAVAPRKGSTSTGSAFSPRSGNTGTGEVVRTGQLQARVWKTTLL